MLCLETSRSGFAPLLLLVLLISAHAVGQYDSAGQGSDTSPSSQSDQQQKTESANGANEQEPPYRKFPPLVGFNFPTPPVPGSENRSFILPGAELNAGVNATEPDGFGKMRSYGTARALGSLSLQRLWKRYDLGVDYIGGAAYLGSRKEGHSLLQSLDADQHVSWSTGQFGFRNSFTYLPEGNFGAGAYGGASALSALGAGGGGLIGLGIFSPAQFASLGEEPRVTNVSLATITQYFSPKNSLFAAGSYGFVHFTDGNYQLVNSQQVVAEAAFNRQLTRKNQISFLYGHQLFQFPTLPEVTAVPTHTNRDIQTDLVNILFEHRIGERMEFIGGAGPQITNIQSPVNGTTNRVTVSGRANLKYRLRTMELFAGFSRYNTNGSGLFGGATTNIVRVSANRTFRRVWLGSFDAGYSQNKALITFFGNDASQYRYIYIGGGLHRQLTRELTGFVSYQFGNLNFNTDFCLTATSCGRSSQREVVLIGVDWHRRPIPLD